MVIDHSSVYTPQLVINGETELIGSDAGKVSDAVSKALKGRAAIVISIDKIEKSGKDIMVNYTLDKTFPNLTMQAALVQKEVVTNILKGENRGLKLTNYNVVRDFNSDHISNTSSGIHLNLPTGAHDNDFAIVLFIQDDASGKVIGVIQKKL